MPRKQAMPEPGNSWSGRSHGALDPRARGQSTNALSRLAGRPRPPRRSRNRGRGRTVPPPSPSGTPRATAPPSPASPTTRSPKSMTCCHGAGTDSVHPIACEAARARGDIRKGQSARAGLPTLRRLTPDPVITGRVVPDRAALPAHWPRLSSIRRNAERSESKSRLQAKDWRGIVVLLADNHTRAVFQPESAAEFEAGKGID